jgi:hypothetical protein
MQFRSLAVVPNFESTHSRVVRFLDVFLLLTDERLLHRMDFGYPQVRLNKKASEEGGEASRYTPALLYPAPWPLSLLSPPCRSPP